MSAISPLDPDRLADGSTVAIERVADELAIVDELLQLDDKDILELGCGRADKTRAIAGAGRGRRIVASEVDTAQHAENLRGGELPGVRFVLGGAEAIPAPDRSFDVVLLFKSLHHVPTAQLDRALAEIARVLRPGGLACVSEPLWRGDYHEVLRIFHDETRVRRAAFAAIVAAVRAGRLEAVSQTFFAAPVRFADFAEFERLVIGATHTRHDLDAATLRRVRAQFERFADCDGARFAQPIRVDLLRRPA